MINQYLDTPKRKNFSGTNITISDSDVGYIRAQNDLPIIQGNTVQDGAPTPENPIAIQNVPSSFNITSCGKNLFKFNPTEYRQNLTEFEYIDNGYIATGNKTNLTDVTSFYNGQIITQVLGLKPNAAYRISFNIELLEGWTGYSNEFLYGLYSEATDYVFLKTASATPTRLVTFDFTMPANTPNFMQFYYRLGGKKLKISDIMIAPQSATTDFAPYNAVTTPFNIKDTDNNLYDLCSLPDGTADEISDGKIIKCTEDVVFNGSEGWKINQTLTDTISFYLSVETEDKANRYCNYFKCYSWYTVNGLDIEYCWNASASYGFKILKSRLATVDVAGFKAFLAELNNAGNPLKMLYELVTPQTYDLHPDEAAKFKNLITVAPGICNVFTTSPTAPLLNINTIFYGEEQCYIS